MKIPIKYQIFPATVIMLDKDADRLRPYLSGWMALQSVMLGIGLPDLERLLILEMMEGKRPFILARLVGRYSAVSKSYLQHKVRRAIG